MTQEKPRLCHACRLAEMQPATFERVFHPRGQVVVVELLTSRCPACGNEATYAAQHAENLARLKARKASYGQLLLGEEILSLRRRYGVTQQQAARLFGKGKIAFSRYENEVSYPDESTTDLLQLAIDRPEVVKWLADRKGVELPLWEVRCEEERDRKVRGMSVFGTADATAKLWASASPRASGGRSAALAAHFASLHDAFTGTIETRAVNEDRFSTEAAVG